MIQHWQYLKISFFVFTMLEVNHLYLHFFFIHVLLIIFYILLQIYEIWSCPRECTKSLSALNNILLLKFLMEVIYLFSRQIFCKKYLLSVNLLIIFHILLQIYEIWSCPRECTKSLSILLKLILFLNILIKFRNP